MGLRLYNTLTRTKEDFVPIDALNVRMYVCGPTVYDFAHIGNARPVIVFDVLFRLLRRLYGAEHVTYVRNVTDVDDKINARAAEEYPDLSLNDAIRRVTERTEAQFHADVAALGALPPTHEPRATEHIGDMIRLIEELVASGNAYVAEGHVLFDVKSWKAADGSPEYGRLSRRSLDEMIAGARVEVAPYKRDPMDFVLWKPSKPGEPAWASPWGDGRPGWHIECSAMSDRWLWSEVYEKLSDAGRARPHEFDIHGGGIDLVFPHHENEIAQSRCAHGTAAMARVWMHNGFLQVEGEKMSKSLGNFVTINELLSTANFGSRKWPGDALRLAMLATHYRQPIDWTVARLSWAYGQLLTAKERTRNAGSAGDPDEEMLRALEDDLNTPQAIVELNRVTSDVIRNPGDEQRARVLRASWEFLGFDLQAFDPEPAIDEDVKRRVGAKIVARDAARKARDFAEADRIRGELEAMGIVLKDSKDAETGELVTTWEVKR